MKILITEPEYFPENSLGIFRSLGNVLAKRLDRTELLKEVSDVDILVVRIETAVDKELIDAAPKLKIIASATTGIDNIDVGAAKKRGIKIANLQGSHTTPTAEHTMALLLALVKKLPWAFQSMLAGQWDRHKFLGRQLSGKTLGLVGFGRIGRRVASYAKIFDMSVVALDPYIDEAQMRSSDVKKETLEELLQSSDVVSLHADLREGKEIIGRKELALMKPSAFLINTARGRLVDEAALLEALRDHKLAGAALDVYSVEPLPPSSPLISYAASNDNLLLTPHIAATAKEAVEAASVQLAQEVAQLASGMD